jgi:TPR repeat protein
MNISHAIHWYQLASEQNLADAINNLGILYESGTGPMKDYEIAAQYYLEAAEMNHLDAMNNLGYCYQQGKGTNRDYGEAARW